MNELLDLLGSLWGFMLVVTLGAAAAGWSWADIKARPRWRILEDERRYLRNELFGLANSKGATGELGGVRKRIGDLEQSLAEARGRSVEVEVLRLRIAELERAAVESPAGGHPQDVAAVDITDYAANLAALEEEARYLRAGRATPAEAAAADAERNRVFALEEELENAQGKLAAAESQIKQFAAAPPAVPPEELQLSQWRVRYLGERVKYLEAEAAKPAPEPVAAAAPAVVAQPVMIKSHEEELAEKERNDRIAWRMRYLEQRALYLEKRTPVDPNANARVAELERELAAAMARMPAIETEAAGLKARIVDLEKQLARVPTLEDQVAAGQAHAQRADDLAQRLSQAETHAQGLGELEHDVTRSRWKGRYLEARVRYLEGKLAAPLPAPAPQPAPQSAPKPAPVAAAPAPKPVEKPAQAVPATPFRMERPAALSAPRNGAPDDLRLIKGLTAQQQGALNALGVFHFEQIAGWRPAHVAWVDQYLNLRGRIGAERWVEQAGALARGEAVLEAS